MDHERIRGVKEAPEPSQSKSKANRRALKSHRSHLVPPQNLEWLAHPELAISLALQRETEPFLASPFLGSMWKST